MRWEDCDFLPLWFGPASLIGPAAAPLNNNKPIDVCELCGLSQFLRSPLFFQLNELMSARPISQSIQY